MAERYGRRALTLAQSAGIPGLTKMALRNLADYLCQQEHYMEAEQLTHDAYQLAIRDGDEIGAAIALLRSAEIAYGREEFQRGREILLEASQIEGLHQRALAKWALLMTQLGRVNVALGEAEEARHYLRKGLEAYPPLRYDMAASLGKLLLIIVDWMQTERPIRSVELLALVSNHPESGARQKEAAHKQLAKIATKLPKNDMAAARARADTLDLAETIARLKVELDEVPDSSPD